MTGLQQQQNHHANQRRQQFAEKCPSYHKTRSILVVVGILSVIIQAIVSISWLLMYSSNQYSYHYPLQQLLLQPNSNNTTSCPPALNEGSSWGWLARIGNDDYSLGDSDLEEMHSDDNHYNKNNDQDFDQEDFDTMPNTNDEANPPEHQNPIPFQQQQKDPVALVSPYQIWNNTISVGRSMSGRRRNRNQILPRAFTPWFDVDNNYTRSYPCFEIEENWRHINVRRKPTKVGFIYMKLMKTGGSSAAGVNMRIAKNIQERYFPHYYDVGDGSEMCLVRNDHSSSRSLKMYERIKDKSFLWTILRHPTSRIISQFFHFGVSREKVEPTDLNFRTWLNRHGGEKRLDKYYFTSLTTSTESEFEKFKTRPWKLGTQIIDDYDFIGITERMDESIVALQLLLNLTTNDVLFINAKNSGNYDDGGHSTGCVYIVPSFVSPGMRKYFNQQPWNNSLDLQLYNAANTSLDMTIESIGYEKFNRALQRYRYLQDIINNVCNKPGVVSFPCNPDGSKNRRNSCLWADSGCGTKCIDRVTSNLHLYANNNQ